MKQFNPPEILKLHAVLLDIHTGSFNLKTVQRNRKGLDESNDVYEDTAARNTLIVLIKKELPNLLVQRWMVLYKTHRLHLRGRYYESKQIIQHNPTR